MLKEQGLTRHDLGRQRFVEEVSPPSLSSFSFLISLMKPNPLLLLFLLFLFLLLLLLLFFLFFVFFLLALLVLLARCGNGRKPMLNAFGCSCVAVVLP